MLRARLQRLEERFRPPDATVVIDGWCYPDGAPCDPPAEVRRKVHEAATGAWEWAVWAKDSGCVLLLAEDGTLQVVELL